METKEKNMMLRFARQTAQRFKLANKRIVLNNKIDMLKEKDKRLELKDNVLFKKWSVLEQKLIKNDKIPKEEITAIKETGKSNIIS